MLPHKCSAKDHPIKYNHWLAWILSSIPSQAILEETASSWEYLTLYLIMILLFI